MTTDDVRSYSLKYPDWPREDRKPFWLDLCERHCAIRIQQGASVMDKRHPVTVSICADCKPKESLR